MELIYLPNELLSRIISVLDGRDVIELSSVNRQLYELCNCHKIWYDIVRHFQISHPSFYDMNIETLNSLSSSSLKSLFINVLDRFQWLLGTWKRQLPVFGGLLLVKYEMSQCRVIGYDVFGIDLEMKLEPMFEISVSETSGPPKSDGEETVYFSANEEIGCVLYSQTDHTLSIEYDKETSEEIRIRCSGENSDLHHKSPLEEMMLDLVEAFGINHVAIPEAIFAGLDGSGIQFRRLCLPSVSQDIQLPVEPGYFAGDYQAHGTEILLLKYESHKILLEKISGDDYVRSGAISVCIDMNCRIDYTEVLKSIAKKPVEFSIKSAAQKFQINEDSCLENHNSYTSRTVEKSLMQSVKSFDHTRTFGIEKSDNSYVAAFKGNITLGSMPDAEVPDYFYYEILAVITDQNNLCILCPSDTESSIGLDLIDEMSFKRLIF